MSDAADTPARLRAVVGKLNRRLTQAARGSGLTQTQLSALGVIARCGPVGLTALAEEEGLNPTMLSRVVAALEAQDLVRRHTDPEDRRAVMVEVTAAGRRTHDRFRDQRSRILAEALETLSPSQRRAIETALPALEELARAATAPVARRGGR